MGSSEEQRRPDVASASMLEAFTVHPYHRTRPSVADSTSESPRTMPPHAPPQKQPSQRCCRRRLTGDGATAPFQACGIISHHHEKSSRRVSSATSCCEEHRNMKRETIKSAAAEPVPQRASVHRRRGGGCELRLRWQLLVRRLGLALLAAVLTLAVCASAAMTFNPANAVEASLFQVIQLNLNSNPLQGDPVIAAEDRLYFINAAGATAASCTYVAPGAANAPMTFSVASAGAGGFTGRLDVAIVDTVFSIGTSYVACYLSTSTQTATLMLRQTFTTATTTSTSLLVWPPVYSSFSLDPTAPSGGEGIVNMTLVQATQANRPNNQGLSGSYTVFLPPCGTGSSSGVACTNPNGLTSLCASIGRTLITAPGTQTGLIQLSNVRSTTATTEGAVAVTGGFTVPYAPNAGGYYVCVPYCADSTAGCGSANVAMSYALVASAAGVPSVATFATANPGLYTRTPAQPQAREQGTMSFTGTGLSANDAVKVVGATQSCTSSTASLLGNLQVGALTYDAASATAQVSFYAPNLVETQLVGRVCYRRAGTGLWSTAYLSASNPVADFTIDVLQPTGFTVSPVQPTVGQAVTLLFTGTGLDASVDTAFLTASTATNPCAVTTGDGVFACSMTGGTASPACTAVVDPAGANQAMQLAVCYRKLASSVAPNHAQVRGTVALAARNPLYSITPYPVYAGQTASISFTGTGLSTTDEVMLVAQADLCSSGTALQGVTVTFAEEVQAGTEYRYELVGAAETCAKVCYRLAGSSEWVATQAATATPSVSAACPTTALYIASYPVRYSFGLSDGSTGPTARETLVARFTSVTGTMANHPLQSVRLVRAANTCVSAPCVTAGSGGTAVASAACAKAASTADYAGPAVATSATTVQANLMAAVAATSYVVCVLDSSAGNAYIPVLAATTTTTATSFSFTTAAANAQFLSAWPSTWHVAMANPTATFTGTGLDPSTNALYAVASTALLSAPDGTASSPPAVCTAPGTTPVTALSTQINTTVSTATSVTTVFTRSDRLTAGDTVYFCYEWFTDGVARVSYGGARTFAARVPTTLAETNLPAAGYRATDPVVLDFTVDSSLSVALSPSADEVYFYRYDASSNPNPSCFCDPAQCTTGTRIDYAEATLTTSTTSATGVTFTNLLGFDNYNANAVYVVCYAVNALSGSSTYMGRINVARANPAYYTATSVAGADNRVGAPLTITARGCLGASCTALSAQDSMVLIPSTAECAQVTSQEPFADTVTPLGDPTVGTGSRSFSQRFVVDAVGDYRVCYRLADSGVTTYNELVFSASYVRQLLTVIEADPSAFTAIPAVPSAGEFTTINLDCDLTTVCAACTLLRILPGERANCWEASPGAGSGGGSGSNSGGASYESANCLTTQSIQFPDQYFAEGTYTLCYGSDAATARRLPGTFTVSAANPASFLPNPSDVREIYTNQASDFLLDITGTGLQTTDAIFLMPALGYSCHDLRTNELQSNGTIATWLAPSIDPLPITVTATGASWVASTQSRRFGAGMLSDTFLCGENANGLSCDMKLCYQRTDLTWAPVPIANEPVIRVVASNPASVTFDRYPLLLDMYAMVTVAGEALETTDLLSIHAGTTCTGEAVTVLVSQSDTAGVPGGFVNADATEWRGVVRFNNSEFASYTVCYWRGTSATEIVEVIFPGQAAGTTGVIEIVPSPLYFALASDNFTVSRAQYPLSQYEEMMVVGTFFENAQTSIALSSVSMISGDTSVAECNYGAFYTATGLTAPYPVVEVFTPIAESTEGAYQARLTAPVGSYALCMESEAYGLFRVVSAPPAATRLATPTTSAVAINSVNPMLYTSAPTAPVPGQRVTFTFSPTSSTTTVTGGAPVALQVGDDVVVLDGSLYECGFVNATATIATGSVEAVAADGTATASLLLPEASAVTTPYAGTAMTVCYRKTGGTFATVPRVTDPSTTPETVAIDRNLLIAQQVPTQWTSQPGQPEEMSPVDITFAGDASNPNYLTVDDVAFLVSWPTSQTTTPTTADCETTDANPPAYTSSGTPLALDAQGVDTTWSIPTALLAQGRYIVCYTATANGGPVYVSSPAFLTVYPLQSPTGAYTYGNEGLVTYRGQRLYLFFNTSEALDVVLDDGLTPAASLAGRDVVTLSTSEDCANPLQADSVAAIPADFGYAAPDATTTLPNGSTIPTPYLLLRVRAPAGALYVCMQRANREPWQAYYTPRVVGGAVNPAVLTVREAPITAFTTTPATPRAWVNQTAVALTYSEGFALANVAQLFFVRYTGTGSTADADEILYDACYRPPVRGEAASDTVALVNTTFSVDLSTLTLPLAFDDAGTYLLCYQLLTGNIGGDAEHVYVASVFPDALAVANPSPISYTVPNVLATGTSFSMTFAALDGIFSTANANQAVIYVLPQGTAPDTATPPSCEGATAPSGGGQTSFTSFTIASATSASVTPLVNQADYFFVCFLTYDQTHAFAVPNAAGGFVFSVGLIGAMSYTTAPSPAYLGQELVLTIQGNELSSNDRVKVVLVSTETLPLVPSGSGSDDVDYTSSCTATSVNADVAVGGTAGSVVNSNAAGLVARYQPRLNATGTYVLCYQSALVGNAWKWVPEIPAFSVYPARPTRYAVVPDPTYETQIGRLIVYDDEGSGLSANDQITLVAAPAAGATGSAAFVCSATATQSADVGLATYVAAESTGAQSVFQVCASVDVQVVVCYRMASSGAEASAGWAEVPQSSPPPTYNFAPVSFEPDPFTGPILTPATFQPRPYERFDFSFTSASAGVEVTFVGFSAAPMQTCALDISYITPTYYSKDTAAGSTFAAALPASGDYVLHLGMSPQVGDPNITHRTLLTVGACDPCTVAPTYTFLGETVTLVFPSGSTNANSLSANDELRLVPASVGLQGLPCEDTTSGPYAGQTFAPSAVGTNGASASFQIVAGTVAEADAYLGEYFLCYRKATDVAFAVVANNAGSVANFAIYPTDLVTVAAMCPEGLGNVFALETVVFNLTVRDPALYPNADFSDADVLVLVPANSAEAGSSTSTSVSNGGAVSACESLDVNTQTVVAAQRDTSGPGFSNWHVTLPSIEAQTSYLVCFRLEYDTTFRSVMPSTTPLLVVEPEDPYAIATSPPLIVPTSPSPSIRILGTGLEATDDAYLVPFGTSCAETCDNPITPVEWVSSTGVTYSKRFFNATTVHIDFSGPLNEVVTLGVCYRRMGRYLTQLGNVFIGEPNPTTWVTDFVPRLGTRPTFTFTGENLTATDAVMLVPATTTATCLTRDAIATGTLLSTSADGTTSNFHLVLLGTGMQADSTYLVCYMVSTVGAYAPVGDTLTVQAGGPATFLSTNTPMQGRATTLSFALDTYPAQVNDDAFIACPTCSCFDGNVNPITVPYGVASAQLTSLDAPMTMRVGFNAAVPEQAFPLCYRIADSGYAQVGGPSAFLTPFVNSPFALEVFPTPTYQGQRMHYNFSNFTTAVPGAATDEVMLVLASRLCWENETLDAMGVVLPPSVIGELYTDPAAVGTGVAAWWLGHVPSLGPNTPTDLTFPFDYLLCYRQGGQPEFVSVPFPAESYTLNAADPASFTTNPATIEAGMYGIQVTFPGAAEGDAAYAVQFSVLTDTVCDDAASVLLSPQAAAFPTYPLRLPGSAPVGSSSAALCYIKAGATVAEVPQLLAIAEGNPSGYTTNATVNPEGTPVARSRQYIAFTVTGQALDAATDTVVFTEVPCAEAADPPTSTAWLARMTELTSAADGTSADFVAQFILPSSTVTPPVEVYMCYSRSGVWREVGAPLTLEAPQPSAAAFYTPSGTPATNPRAGQHLYLELTNADETAGSPRLVSVIAGGQVGDGTWCHNFTDADVLEPGLVVESPAMLNVPVWQTAGASRLCIMNNATTPWADVGATADAADLPEVGPANPSSMTVFPSPPRVGQRVTLTFALLLAANAGDVVKITAPGLDTPCESAESITGFPATLPVTVVDASTTRVTLTDETDPLLYRSFNTTGDYRVCYYSAAEAVWAVAGGSLAAGTITVEERVPQSWQVASGEAVLGRNFTLSFTDALGVMDASADIAWAAPDTQNCTINPYTEPCPRCIIFELDPAASTSTNVVTAANVSLAVGTMNVCYQLASATAAEAPGTLTVANGPIECIEEGTVTVGQDQRVTFRVREGEDTSADTWRVSFYATMNRDCAALYAPGFVPGMARQVAANATSVSYQVLWPVNFTDARYTICYSHNGEVGPVCTCGQIDAQTGECFVETVRGSPESFTPSPSPTYVGETITLTFAVALTLVAYPPTDIKFVAYVNELTSCADAAAFTPTSGTTPTRVSDTQYTYTFKHDYALGESRLLVCALSDLSPNYIQVPSTVDAATADPELGDVNLLWIRPFMALTSFPSLADYRRALQSLVLTFTHQTQLPDDLVSLGDTFTFVTDPYDCVESFIETQDPTTVMSLFALDDTAFITTPAPVNAVNATLFSSTTIATFSVSGVGSHYLCYRLAAGTWAPVLPVLTIGDALTDGCTYTNPVSPTNSDNSDLRAMQYIPTVLTGDASGLFAGLVNANVDAVRVVPQDALCMDDQAAVYTGTVASPATPTTPASVDTIAFAPAAGTYKLCYRFGGAQSTVANWSPACGSITVTAPSPTANHVGCLNQGQSLDVDATHATGFTFAAADTVRYVAGTTPCLYPNGTAAASLSSILLNDATQAATGFPLGTSAAGATELALPYILLGTGVTSIRLCYTDAAGNQFAVPLDTATRPTLSALAVRPRQPGAFLHQTRVQLGQRVLLNFTAAVYAVGSVPPTVTSPYVLPWLDPYAAPPSPLVPGPIFDGTYDAATLWPLTAGTVYRDGRCAAALRAGTDLGLRGVYGTGSPTPFTLGAYDPATAAFHVACYRLATCGVVDVGTPVRVLPYNPAATGTSLPSPRRGQLFDVTFTRDTTTSDSAPLTPGQDRGAKVANLASCWSLADTAGSLVTGTTTLTLFTAFFPAEAPASATPSTTTRACYRLVGGSWSEVPDGVASVLAANPTGFATTPATPRADQLNEIVFTGTGLGASDTVKIIALSMNCSEDSTPPSGIVAYTADGVPVTGSSAGWQVTRTSADGTTAALNMSSTLTGEFSVCYRLAADSVWTLVYSNLNILERNPADVTQTPVAALEGELFTLNFTASATGALSANDRVALYLGSGVNCAAPGDAVVITAGASNTDHLPSSIAFQVDAGTRGPYTLCYLVSLGGGQYSPVWGFDEVAIEPNPTEVSVYPVDTRVVAGADGTLRLQELVSLVFHGWGLVAEADDSASATGGAVKTDAVKLIDAAAGGTGSYSDAACRSQPSVGDIFYYPLYANGTYSVQVLRAQSAVGQYWICYKLNGGQYHAIGGDNGQPLRIAGAANPGGATSSKLTGTALGTGESMDWTVNGLTDAACNPADMLFYSENGCNDLPYYVNAAATTTTTSPDAFVWGAASLDCAAGAVQQVRLAWSPAAVQAATASANNLLSLCFFNASATAARASPVVSVLQNYSIPVTVGVPPPLSTTITAPAQTPFTVSLAVNPTATDFATLVADPVDCQGTTAPTSGTAELFMSIAYDTTTSMAVLTTAVATPGTYYLCYSYQSAECVAGTGRDCARIVGTVVATAARPQAWSATPSPLYTTDTATVAFVNEDATAAASGSAQAWLARVPTTTTTTATRAAASMEQVASLCAETRPSDSNSAPTTATTTYALTYNAEAATWGSPALETAGSYVLCYATASGSLALFPPVGNAGPEVRLSNVTSVLFPTPPTVGTSVILLQGGGLSGDDEVTAVALPPTSSNDGSAIPADICDPAAAYSPRIAANPSSTSGGVGGQTVVPRDFTFTQTGDYVLCYLPANLATTGGTLPWRVSETSFAVVPSVLGVTVVSEVQVVNVPLDLQFTGTGLRATDMAALVFVGNMAAEDLTVETVCGATPATAPATTTYTAMTEASADGTTAFYTTTPTTAGDHMVCFAESTNAASRLLPTRIVINEQSVASVAFSVQPGSCTALLTCNVQPSVTLLDAAGAPTPSPLATITMQAADATTGELLEASAMTGGNFYSFTNDTTFDFFALRFASPGDYVMVATVTLAGGALTFEARSTAFTVAESGGGGDVQSVASVVCSPADLLPTRTTPVLCTVDTLISTGPSTFTIQPSAGTASECVTNGTTTDGLPRCSFTVTPPAATAASVNFIAINVVPAAPFTAWPVRHSPVVERLPTAPEASTTIACTPNTTAAATVLPSGVVRAGSVLSCTVQGRAMVNGIVSNIVAPPESLRVSAVYYTTNDPTATSATTTVPVDLGLYPQDPNGAYTFDVTVAATGLLLRMEGQVAATDGSGTFVAMTNSPVAFRIVGTPATTGSSLTCVSAVTGSALWMTPLEAMRCALRPVDANGAAINALGSEFGVRMPQGGSGVFLNPDVASPVLNITATAPPAGPAPAAAVAATLRGSRAVAPAPFASTYNYGFSVEAVYNPAVTDTALATYAGNLVYVTGFAGGTTPTLPRGAAVTLGVLGSGLDTQNRYVAAETAACTMAAAGAPVVEATASAGATAGSLSLSFTVPQNATSLYLCFAPSDARTSLQLLLSQAFATTANGNGGGNGGSGTSTWTSADLALLIVGVVFLFLLFVLLVVLLIRLLCCGGRGGGGAAKGAREAVPMPPRANDRFLYRPAAALLAPSNPTTTPPPPPLAATTTATPAPAPAYNDSSRPESTRVRVNIQDTVNTTTTAANQNILSPFQPLTSAAPLAIHTDPSASTATTARTTSSSTTDGPKRHKHRHRSGPRSSSSSNSVKPEAAAASAPPVKSKSPYVDLDLVAAGQGDAPTVMAPAAPLAQTSSPAAASDSLRGHALPPLPPPPRQQTPTSSSLGNKDAQPPAPFAVAPQPSDVVASLPPLPPAPAAPSGPYQHLHHTTPPPPPQVTPAAGNYYADDDDDDDDAAAPTMVGPFVVAGHTSRPMVSSKNSSIRK